MLFALNKEGEKFYIDFANKNEEYFCPCCYGKTILKLGTIRRHHFAHHRETACMDNWHYDMTEWHYNWQGKFPLECQEIVKEFGGKKHRADVLIEKEQAVFEFQHSNISSSEFAERNSFYNKLGYKVIWIFDIEEQFVDGKIENYKGNLWSWCKPRRTFDFFNYKDQNVQIYLQLGEDNLIRVTWCTADKGFSRFATDGHSYDEDFIVHMFDHEKKVIKQELKLSHLYDKLIQLYSKDHTTYYFGCPISRTHMCANCNIDIAKNRYTEIMPCMDCRFQCISSNYNEMICKKRFLDLQLSGNTVVQIESKNKDGFINKLSYLDNGTRKYLELPTFIQNITKDVFTLWKENNCAIATFRNVKTGKYIRIIKNPIVQFKNYHKVYGYLLNDKYSFSPISVELFGLDEPEWVCEWFKKKT